MNPFIFVLFVLGCMLAVSTGIAFTQPGPEKFLFLAGLLVLCGVGGYFDNVFHTTFGFKKKEKK